MHTSEGNPHYPVIEKRFPELISMCFGADGELNDLGRSLVETIEKEKAMSKGLANLMNGEFIFFLDDAKFGLMAGNVITHLIPIAVEETRPSLLLDLAKQFLQDEFGVTGVESIRVLHDDGTGVREMQIS